MKPSAKLFLFSLILCFIFTWLLILGTMGSHEKKNFTNKSDKRSYSSGILYQRKN